jgi:hypothetical protein
LYRPAMSEGNLLICGCFTCISVEDFSESPTCLNWGTRYINCWCYNVRYFLNYCLLFDYFSLLYYCFFYYYFCFWFKNTTARIEICGNMFYTEFYLKVQSTTRIRCSVWSSFQLESLIFIRLLFASSWQ